jgi:hypothetical protein
VGRQAIADTVADLCRTVASRQNVSAGQRDSQ